MEQINQKIKEIETRLMTGNYGSADRQYWEDELERMKYNREIIMKNSGKF